MSKERMVVAAIGPTALFVAADLAAIVLIPAFSEQDTIRLYSRLLLLIAISLLCSFGTVAIAIRRGAEGFWFWAIVGFFLNIFGLMFVALFLQTRLARLRSQTREELRLLRYLTSNDPFEIVNLQTYLSMCGQLGRNEIRSLVKERMDQPREAARIPTILKNLRSDLAHRHLEALKMSVDRIKDLPSERGRNELLQEVTRASEQARERIEDWRSST